MPSIKHRQRVIARSFLTASPQYQDIVIPWQSVFLAASGVANMSASIAVATPTASGPQFLQFSGTSSGCKVTVQFPVPPQIALAVPAAASGQIIFDWLNKIGAGAVVTVAACLSAVNSGSEWAGTAACKLITATCATMTGGSALAINSTSLVNFNVPGNRTSHFILRFAIAGQDADNTSGSEFHLQDIRLRIATDRIGS